MYYCDKKCCWCITAVSLVVTELVMTGSCMIAMAKRRYKQNTLLKLKTEWRPRLWWRRVLTQKVKGAVVHGDNNEVKCNNQLSAEGCKQTAVVNTTNSCCLLTQFIYIWPVSVELALKSVEYRTLMGGRSESSKHF